MHADILDDLYMIDASAAVKLMEEDIKHHGQYARRNSKNRRSLAVLRHTLLQPRSACLAASTIPATGRRPELPWALFWADQALPSFQG